MAETLVFPEENNECLPDFEGFFYENEILETSNDLDDSEISLFIEENRYVLKYNRKDKTDLKSVKERREIEKFPLRKLTIFYVICLSKSGNGTHPFSGAVSTNAQLLSVRNLHR